MAERGCGYGPLQKVNIPVLPNREACLFMNRRRPEKYKCHRHSNETRIAVLYASRPKRSQGAEPKARALTPGFGPA